MREMLVHRSVRYQLLSIVDKSLTQGIKLITKLITSK